MAAKFDFGASLSRVWKDEASGELWFEGVAATTGLDKQKERFTPQAIEGMGLRTGVDLMPRHPGEPGEELGVTKQHVIDGDRLCISGVLHEDNPRAVQLYNRMVEGKPYELSVGGSIKAAHWGIEKGARIRFLDEVELDHIAVCNPGRAANPETFFGALAKALDEDEGMVTAKEQDMVHEAIAGLEERLAEMEKAGARHSASDVKGLHSAIDALRNVCGCADCTAAMDAVAESGYAAKGEMDSTDFITNLREDEAEAAASSALSWQMWDTLEDTIAAIIAAPMSDRGALLQVAFAQFSQTAISRVMAVLTEPATLALQDNPAAQVAKAEEAPAMSEETLKAPEPGQEITTETPAAQEGEQAVKADAEHGEELAKAVAEKDAELDDLRKQLAEGQEALEKAQARVTELEAQPAAGGPVNGQATDTVDKLDAPTEEGTFQKAARIAREQEGTTAGLSAQREASDALTKAAVRMFAGRR